MPRAKTQKKTTNSKPAKTVTKTSTGAAAKKATTKKVTKQASKTIVKVPKNLKVSKKAQKPQKGGNVEEEEVAGKRYFKCILINEEGEVICTGRYSGKKPKQAASKACTRIYDTYKDDENNMPAKIIFGMHECTRASKKKKKYFYTGSRVRLEEPEEVTINKIDPKTGKKMVIRYNYNNDVKKLTDVDNCKEYPLLCNYDTKDDEVEQVAGAKKAASKATKKVAKKAPAKKPVKAAKKPVKATKKAVAPKKQLKVVKKTAAKKTASKGKKSAPKKGTSSKKTQK